MRWSRPTARALAKRQPAQNMVEFALVLPLFLTLMMVGLQFALLFLAQISVIWLTQDVVRYVSAGSPENWRFADSCHVTYRNSRLPPLLLSSNFTQFTFVPAYTPGASNCSVVTSNSPPAACPSTYSPCRYRGGSIQLRMQYNPSNLLFLPTTFFGVSIPTTLSWYSAASVME